EILLRSVDPFCCKAGGGAPNSLPVLGARRGPDLALLRRCLTPQSVLFPSCSRSSRRCPGHEARKSLTGHGNRMLDGKAASPRRDVRPRGDRPRPHEWACGILLVSLLR